MTSADACPQRAFIFEYAIRSWHPCAYHVSWGVSRWCHIEYPISHPKIHISHPMWHQKAVSYLWRHNFQNTQLFSCWKGRRFHTKAIYNYWLFSWQIALYSWQLLRSVPPEHWEKADTNVFFFFFFVVAALRQLFGYFCFGKIFKLPIWFVYRYIGREGEVMDLVRWRLRMACSCKIWAHDKRIPCCSSW